MTETKREVFEGLLESYMYSADIVIDEISTDGVADRLNLGNIIASTRDRYAAALPDDLPVIPKAVGKYIQEHKAAHDSLAFALTARFIPNEVVEWMFMVAGDPDTELSQIEYVKQQDTFARAWLLGVWKVKETDEVVKL